MLFVVDQARADYFTRFADRFEHGIGRLLAESVAFTETRHDHAITKTAPGHASLASGVHPARHGIVGNNWFDRESGTEVDADEDEAYEPDRAPTRMLATTLGDWLKETYPLSKVFAISVKSRASVTSAGHAADGAFWFDTESGRFVTSDYYPNPEPDWLESFHRDPLPDRLFGTSWEVLPGAAAAAHGLGFPPIDRGIVKRRPPRPIGPVTTVTDERYYRDFRDETPFADAYLGELAAALVTGESLGADQYPDLLVVAFSALDYIGHRYGPASAEVVDTLLRLDRVIGTFLEQLDTQIGLDNVVVSLTSDHGTPPIPEYAGGRRFWTEERACIQQAPRALEARFGEAEWLAADLVFDRDVLAAEGVALADAEDVLAEAISICPGVERVWTGSRLTAAASDHDSLTALFAQAFHPDRSSDLIIQNEAGALMVSSTETNHGSPHDYDRHVPWLLRLPASAGANIAEPVSTVDVAPTLAALLEVPVPADLDGRSRLALAREATAASPAARPPDS